LNRISSSINKVNCYNIAKAIAFNYAVCSIIRLIKSINLKDQDISTQVQQSRVNKLHKTGTSYILNTKVELFRPCGVNKFNLVRFESNAATSPYDSKTHRPLNLVREDIANGNTISNTNGITNGVLVNQKVIISQKELDQLLKLPSVKFDLPITNETYPSLLALGKPQSRRSNTGVYIFTHKLTGNKYVGSSNDLARRFKQYFDKDALFGNKNTGQLTPLIDKEGLGAFSLDVTVVPASYPKYSYCFLEQYYLLDKSFNLNTHKVVNFRVNQGFKIFLYDLDCKTLYYSSSSLNAFCADLGIHHSSYKKCISSGAPFLDFFVISNTLITEAVPANLSESDVRELLAKRRKENLNKQAIYLGKEIEVFDKDTNEIKIYDSTSKVAYRFGMARTTVKRYIVNGKGYQNRYYFKFSIPLFFVINKKKRG